MYNRLRFNGTITAAILLALSLLSSGLPFLLLFRLVLPPAPRCDSLAVLHEELLSAVLRSAPKGGSVVHRDPPSLSNEIYAARREVRRVGARLRAAYLDARMTPSRRIPEYSLTNEMLDALEFGHVARHPMDGALMYVIALLGSRTRSAIELDAASGCSVFRGAAAFALYDGWSLLALHSFWSGFSVAQRFYEGADRRSTLNWRKKRFPDSRVIVAEENLSNANDVRDAIRKHGIGGDVDLLFLLLDGLELHVWRLLTGVSPRVVVFVLSGLLGRRGDSN
jgi:hypothetical protein